MGKKDWMYTNIYQSDRAGEGAEKDKWSKETNFIKNVLLLSGESVWHVNSCI